MVKKYYIKVGAPIGKKYAQTIGETLNQIKEKNKRLNASLVVEEARKPSSKIHRFFEWDNAKASEKWRLEQAGCLIRSVVEVVEIEGIQSKQRSFYNVTNEKKESIYVTLKEATTNHDYKKQLLDNLIKHLESTTTLMKMFRDV